MRSFVLFGGLFWLCFATCLPSSGHDSGGLNDGNLLVRRADSCHSGLVGAAVDLLQIFHASKFCSTFLGYPVTTLVVQDVNVASTTTTTFTTTFLAEVVSPTTIFTTSFTGVPTYTTTATTKLARRGLEERAIPLPAFLTGFVPSLVSHACSCVATPSTVSLFHTTTITTGTTVLTTSTTSTSTSTSVPITTVTDTAQQIKVFQQIDAGENCPGFGGSVTPITAVNTASIDACIGACATTGGCTLLVTFNAGDHYTCELFSGFTNPPLCDNIIGAFTNFIYELVPHP